MKARDLKQRLCLRPWTIAAVVIALACGPPVLAASNTSTTAPQAVFGMTPAQEGQTPLPQGHFEYSLPAGATVHDAVVLENLTQAPLALQLFPADLIPLAGGGFGVAQLGQTMHGVGAWTQVAAPAVTLPPAGQQAIGFTLTVPPGTFSGDYGGAVVAQNAPTTGHGIAIQTRVALQIQIHVTGATAQFGATVGPLHTNVSNGAISYTAVVTNTGNESFVFAGTVHIQNGSSAVDIAVPMSPAKDYLFPGQRVTLAAHWDHAPHWGTVTGRATVVATPAKGSPGTFSDGPVTLHFFPWLLVILAIIALLLLLAVMRQAWRRRDQWLARLRAARDRRRAVRQFKEQLS